MRRYLIGINTGGTAITLTFAASMTEKGIHPIWAVLPVGLFTFGLSISGASLLYAKHKALQRKKAAEANEKIPKYDAWFQRNFTLEIVTFAVFVMAVFVALYQLPSLEL